MERIWQYIKNTVRKADILLLVLCLVATAFGCLAIASATNPEGTLRYVFVQIGAAVIGIFLFFLVSSIDADFFSEHRSWLVIFNVALLLMLVPFGTDNGTGNKSWLDFPFLPVQIQPGRPTGEESGVYPLRAYDCHGMAFVNYNDPAVDKAAEEYGLQFRKVVGGTDGDDKAYVNFASGDETPEFVYGKEAYERLRRIKQIWDPENVFRGYFSLV